MIYDVNTAIERKVFSIPSHNAQILQDYESFEDQRPRATITHGMVYGMVYGMVIGMAWYMVWLLAWIMAM